MTPDIHMNKHTVKQCSSYTQTNSSSTHTRSHQLPWCQTMLSSPSKDGLRQYQSLSCMDTHITHQRGPLFRFFMRSLKFLLRDDPVKPELLTNVMNQGQLIFKIVLIVELHWMMYVYVHQQPSKQIQSLDFIVILFSYSMLSEAIRAISHQFLYFSCLIYWASLTQYFSLASM